jgi:Zn-dependent peptidase ImmA (M78 family)
MALTRAEKLLKKLGITEPDEIDLEAIAFYVGARIRYRLLDSCEARIVGSGDNAIITINARSSSQRQRFSIGHELGHWEHHRGQQLVCRLEGRQSTLASERLADSYAADLLMPTYLFRPLALQQSMLNFKAVSTLAETFKTSHTATAIRLIESDHSPALLVCHGAQKRKWFVKAPSVPEHWMPKALLDANSSAMEVLYGMREGDLMPRKIKAEAWFDCWETRGYDIYEQTIRVGDGEVLTILLLTDQRMLEERN